jgi:hypothetical protein
MARIAGLPLSNSQRAFDLYLKTRYTMSLHRGPARGVVLATATPVANSMAEIHTFQRYLQPARARWGWSSSTPGRPPSGRPSRRWRSRPTAAATG